MITKEDVFQILSETESYWSKEISIPIAQSVGRVLAAPLYSSIDSPPFHKSAMDGFAFSSQMNKDKPLVLMETIGAGDVPQKEISGNYCAAIMTGAMLPSGADRVVRVEYTHKENDFVFIDQIDPLENIIKQGENLKKGDLVLSPRIIKSSDVGIFASLGLSHIMVREIPSIGIISTGSELCEPGTPLKNGMIYNSNGPQLEVQAQRFGGVVTNYGAVIDNPKKMRDLVEKALSESDIVILSGGVSMGEFDYVPQILKENNIKKVFHKAKIKPGKPIFFGKGERNYVFGLPGNPVSTYIIFEVFVTYFIYHLMGLEFQINSTQGCLKEPISRKTYDRAEFFPIKWVDGGIVPVSYHGSSHLNALGESQGLIVLEPGQKEFAKGDVFSVRPL